MSHLVNDHPCFEGGHAQKFHGGQRRVPAGDQVSQGDAPETATLRAKRSRLLPRFTWVFRKAAWVWAVRRVSCFTGNVQSCCGEGTVTERLVPGVVTASENPAISHGKISMPLFQNFGESATTITQKSRNHFICSFLFCDLFCFFIRMKKNPQKKRWMTLLHFLSEFWQHSCEDCTNAYKLELKSCENSKWQFIFLYESLTKFYREHSK